MADDRRITSPLEHKVVTGFVDFLIKTQQVRLGSASPEDLELPDGVDWAGFLGAATYHGLILGSFGPLCQSNILSRMPPEVASDIQERHQRLSAFHLAQAAELVRIMATLKGAEIPTLAYKGPALTQQIFGDLISRESVDLDLLVPEASVFAALDLLEKEGYAWAEIGPRPHRTSELSANHAFTLRSHDRRFLVDLHWHLAEDVALDFVPEISSLFEDPEMVPMLGCSVAAVRVEKLLPLLGFHSVKHSWYQLKWFVDIATLARLPEFDWDAAFRYMDSAESSSVAQVSHLGLLVADRLFDCSLPAAVRRLLEKDKRAVALVSIVVDDIRASRTFDMSEQHRVLLALNAGAWSRLKRAGSKVAQASWDILTPSH
jgi:hypothetical protein